MMDAASRFGVELKSTGGGIGSVTPPGSPKRTQPSPPPPPSSGGGVDRAKASVYSWDDPRLQKTAVVTKRITKAATTVQRFIRACISHWKYYNEERLPLLEELKDIERRRQEELIEVEEYKKRGYEEAKFELEAELAMPSEEFDKCQQISRELKQAIKDEEQAIAQCEQEINQEKQHAKKIGREKHEIETQHTLSRLDVEIPALEAEQVELQEVHGEFSEIVAALQAQMAALEGNIQLELRHKKRLIKCMASMLQELASRGAKPKLIANLKLLIKYKGEPPPPKPLAAPQETQQNQEQQETGDTLKKETEENEAGGSETMKSNEQLSASEAEKSETENAVEHRPTTVNGGERQQQQQSDSSDDSTSHSVELSDFDGTAGDTTGKPQLRKGRRPSQNTKATKAREAPAARSVKKNKSADSTRSSGSAHSDEAPAFDWGSGTSRTRGKSPKSRSKIPSQGDKKKTKNSGDDEGGFQWSDMQNMEGQKDSKEEKRRHSVDPDDLARKSHEIGNEHAFFNWEALAENHHKNKKDKDKDKKDKKKKDRVEMKRSKSNDMEHRGKRGSIAKDGHFSWAFHASNG